MSQFFGNLGYLWPGNWFGGTAVPDPHAPPANPDKVEAEEPIDRSLQWTGALTGMGHMPGFDAAPPASDWTRWQQKRFSTIAFIHAVAVRPVLAGKQSIAIKNDKGNPALAEKMKADAEKVFLPKVMDWLPGALESQHFGRWLQEVVWDVVDGSMVPVAFRPVLPGDYIAYKDAGGQFSGFQIRQEYRDKRYAFLSVNDEQYDPIFGWSRNDNCREEWWRIRQSEINADRTERKASGIQMGIGLPTGASFTDDNGNPIVNKATAQAIIDAAQQGQSFQYPTIFWDKKTLKEKPELADVSLVKLEMFDWGNTGPAIESGISRRAELKVDIVRAWCRPEREAMEGQHGTKAEAGTQGAIGTTDSELLGQQACRQFSRQVVNTWATNKYGPDAADMIAIEIAPLSDPQQVFLQGVVTTAMQNTSVADELLANIDQRPLLERVEIPMVSEADAAKKLADQKAEKAANAPQIQPMNGDGGDGVPVKVNGNGNGNGNGQKNGKANPLNAAAKRLLKRAG